MKKVLFVDDEQSILNSLKRLLRKENYKVLLACGPEAGLEVAASENPDLVVSDFRMPKMNGVSFLKIVKEKSPDTSCVILSGYADEAAITEAMKDGQISKYLFKPWKEEVLKEELRGILERK